MRIRRELQGLLALFTVHWKLFLGVHVAANLFSFTVLTPLYTLLLGWLILASGDVALTDEDILFFIMSPRGLLIFVFAAGLLLTLMVFEQAALFVAALRAREGRPVSVWRLLRHVLQRWSVLLQLAMRMVIKTAVFAAPFLAAAGLVYYHFLSEFDINFYLFTRPPALWWAGGAMVLILVVMAWVLMRVFAGWAVALPILLLERENPAGALRFSNSAAATMRRPIALVLLAWLLVNGALLAILAGLLDLGVWAATRVAGDSLQTMAYLMGGLMVLWTLGNLAVTFFSSCALSLGILTIFRELIPDASTRRLDDRLAPGPGDRQWRISGAMLGVLLLSLVVTAGIVLDRTVERLDLGEQTDIIAHRGASIDAPENTLAAMEEAIRQGADWLEIDVQETATGEIVVIHDRDLKKVGASPLRVWDTPLEELQSVDVGSWLDPRFNDQRVPTLRDLLLQVKGRVKVIIELKYYGREQRFEELVAAIVDATGMAEDIVVMSLSLPGVRKMKSLRPDWQVGLLSSVAVGDATRLEVDFLAINARFASRRFISNAHRRGRGVLTWTVNDPVMMSAMMSKNVDGIITDKPGLASKVRAERAGLGLHERLMIQFAGLLGGRVVEQ